MSRRKVEFEGKVVGSYVSEIETAEEMAEVLAEEVAEWPYMDEHAKSIERVGDRVLVTLKSGKVFNITVKSGLG